jgi:hypothetical protein
MTPPGVFATGAAANMPGQVLMEIRDDLGIVS